MTKNKNEQSRNIRRLALNYFGIIVVVTLLYSAIIFTVASARLAKPLPKPNFNDDTMATRPIDFDSQVNQRIIERDRQVQLDMVVALVVFDLIVLAFGGWASYLLAKKTLLPMENALAEQKRFVSDASHELRTPLTGLLLSSEVMLRKKKYSDTEVHRMLEQNVAKIKELQGLTNSLLDLSKFDERSHQYSQADIAELVDRSISSYRDLAEQRGVTIKHEVVSNIVNIPVFAVERILAIYLDNAIKYSKVGGDVVVCYGGRRITVVDNGVGISDDDLPKIFDRFYQVDRSRQVPGYGIGLSLAQKIANSSGLKIGVESKLGDGSKFWIQIA